MNITNIHFSICCRFDFEKVYCPHHPDSPLVEDHHAGDQICSACGLVVGDR